MASCFSSDNGKVGLDFDSELIAGDWETGTVSPLMFFSPTTMTFYKGPAPEDYLRERTEQIVASNPWLSGRVVRAADGQVKVRYNSNGCGKDLFHVTEESLDPSVGYEQMNESVGAHVVVPASKAMDKDLPLFKATLVKNGNESFAFVLSISHLLADGHTYYNFYKMYDASAKVQQLNEIRKPEYKEGKQDVVDYEVLDAPGYIMNVFKNLLFAKAPLLRINYIDSGYIQTKKSEVSAPDFISTNDIVVSSFARLCESDAMRIAVNLRDVVPKITASDAGNYMAVVQFNKDEACSPEGVRRAVKAVKQGKPLPSREYLSQSTWSLAKEKVGIVTNWATFYEPLSFHGCEQSLHIPALDVSAVPIADLGVVFMAMPDKVAMLSCSRSLDDDAWKRCLQNDVFGEEVMKA